MTISEVNRSVRCDIPNCKNFAKIKIQKPGFVMIAGLYLCDDCAKEMYELFADHMTDNNGDPADTAKQIYDIIFGADRT